MLLSRASVCLVIVFFTLLIRASAQEEPEELVRLKGMLDTCRTDLVEVQLLNDIAWEYYFSNFDSSEHYVNLALNLSDKINSPYWKAVSLEMKAILKDLSGQTEEALNLYLEVIPLRESLGGVGLESTYNNMAVIFRNQENYEKALKYFRTSYEIELAAGNLSGIAGSLNNMALCELKLGKVDSVPKYLYRAIEYSKDAEEDFVLTSAYLNLADYYLQASQNDSARQYYSKSLEISRALNDLGSVAVALFGLAEISSQQGAYSSAFRQLDSAAYYSSIINNQEYNKRVFGFRSELYAALGDYRKAYEQLRLFDAAKDSVAKRELVEITNGLEARYESERKERQIAELELSSTAQALRAETSRSQRNLLLSLAIILLLGMGFGLQRFLIQRKNARLLAEKNDQVERALRDRETLLREIHHRVKNNLQVVSSLLSIQGREIKDGKALEAVNESRNRVRSMALIHQFLYGEKHLNSIDMPEYVDQLCKHLFETYRVDHDAVELQVEVCNIMLDVDTAIPVGLIINELITNSLKYAFPNGRSGVLRVSLREEGGKLELTVADNGVGVSGVEAQSSSFGMRLLRAFQQKLDADFDIRSEGGLIIRYWIGNYKTSPSSNT